MLKNLRVPSCILDTKKNGAPLPDTTNSNISGLWTGLSGTIHPKTIGPRVEDSNCIKPPYSLGNGTGSGPAISRTYENKKETKVQPTLKGKGLFAR
ncbi:hypothetical protein V1477_017984 [Vespula maculifrons]|uniref:Uncharacterized protein n=1 Tax=Vespula maculifrons TaxID=7453 RepID=A0ABD2B1D1_VESMC